jgi:hypothetical protein
MDALTYRTQGDQLIPNLTLPKGQEVQLGKYALMRLAYLQEHRPALYSDLLVTCALNVHLTEIEQTAMERMELLTRQMAAKAGVDEKLKASDQMKWVGLMNNIRERAEETIRNDLIYA